MKFKKRRRIVNLIMYNGSADERNQQLYDKAGYIGYLVLCLGVIAEAAIKVSILKLDIQQVWPEMALIAVSLLVVTIFLVNFRVTGFENTRQQRAIGISFVFVGAGISITGYTAMFLKLPQSIWLLNLGVFGWLLPLIFGLTFGMIFWVLVKIFSSFLNKRVANLGTEK